jgi:CRAL/TRIO domain
MNGIDVAIADPIEPVCPEDDRPSVKELIKEHGEKINKIRVGLIDHPLFDSNKHDDLWILRFFMSHKKTQPAIDAAKYTLEFRNEHKLDEVDIRPVAPHQVQSGKVREYLSCWKDDAIVFTHPHPQRGVVCFLKFASMDQHKVVEKLTEDYWLDIFMYSSEWAFQWLDYVTRTTGRLTKSVRFIDITGTTMSSLNRECSKRDGKVMGIMEDCYPQLLESIFPVNPPLIIDALWKFFRVLLPKRVVSKFDFVKPLEREGDRKKLYRHISENDLPEYYGGKNPLQPHHWATHVSPSTSATEVEEELGEF